MGAMWFLTCVSAGDSDRKSRPTAPSQLGPQRHRWKRESVCRGSWQTDGSWLSREAQVSGSLRPGPWAPASSPSLTPTASPLQAVRHLSLRGEVSALWKVSKRESGPPEPPRRSSSHIDPVAICAGQSRPQSGTGRAPVRHSSWQVICGPQLSPRHFPKIAAAQK